MQIGLDSLIDPALAPHVKASRDLNAASSASGGSQSPPDPSTPEGLREARVSLPVPEISTGPPAEELLAEAAGRQVPVRILAPESGTPRGVYLNIHGGGFYLGGAARGDARNRRLAESLRIVVVSVDYRLAPEHPWPAAPDDCETAALWLLNQAATRFGATRLAIGGPSAGPPWPSPHSCDSATAVWSSPLSARSCNSAAMT